MQILKRFYSKNYWSYEKIFQDQKFVKLSELSKKIILMQKKIIFGHFGVKNVYLKNEKKNEIFAKIWNYFSKLRILQALENCFFLKNWKPKASAFIRTFKCQKILKTHYSSSIQSLLSKLPPNRDLLPLIYGLFTKFFACLFIWFFTDFDLQNARLVV